MSFGRILDRICMWIVWANKKFEHKDAYITTLTKSLLNSLEVCVTQTLKHPSTNRIDHKKKLCRSGMEHGGACGVSHIKEYTEFPIMCVANSESIKREGSLFLGHSWFPTPMKFGLEDTGGEDPFRRLLTTLSSIFELMTSIRSCNEVCENRLGFRPLFCFLFFWVKLFF